jgi:hypothetical protein
MPTTHLADFLPRRILGQHERLRPLRVLAWPLAVLFAGCGSLPAPVTEAPVPAQLDPGPGHRLVATLHARGVQVYQCREAKETAGRFEWAFVGPEAELLDAGWTPSGRHYAGPSWEAPDGSRVVGSVRERADATVPGAIPLLLLATRSTGPAGRFSDVVAIQRLNTRGGSVPASACAPANASQQVRVPYTADYRLFAAAR